MIIKLIERWNRSDETRDRRHESFFRSIPDKLQTGLLLHTQLHFYYPIDNQPA